MGEKKITEGKLKKRSKNNTPPHTPSKDFYFTIVEYIKKNGKLPDIGLSKQAMNYHITKLKMAGVVENIGYGTWKVTSAKNDIVANMDKKRYKKEVQNSKTTHPIGKNSYINPVDKLTIRGHGFVFKIIIPRKIQNWKNRRIFLKNKKIQYKQISSYGEGIEILGHKVFFYEKAMVLYISKFMDFYNKSAKLSLADGFIEAKKIAKRIENIFGINIKTQGGYAIKICKQHYGNINNELAEECNKKKQKIKCLDKNGREWLLVDDSLRLNELETVHSGSAQKDMDKVVVPWFNGLKDMFDRTGDPFTPNKVMELIGTQAAASAQASTNITTITELLNILVQREAFRSGIDLSKPIDQLRDELERKIKNNLTKKKKQTPPSYVG